VLFTVRPRKRDSGVTSAFRAYDFIKTLLPSARRAAGRRGILPRRAGCGWAACPSALMDRYHVGICAWSGGRQECLCPLKGFSLDFRVASEISAHELNSAPLQSARRVAV
jgi:hypothetical protein